MKRPSAILGMCLVALPSLAPTLSAQVSFSLSIDQDLRAEPYTGRVYVALAQPGKGEPRRGMGSWFNGPPLFAVDVENLKPGESVTLDAQALFHPDPMADLEAGEWMAQGVARCSLDSPNPGMGSGDLCSEPVALKIAKDGTAQVVSLVLTRTVQEPAFEETERVKLFELVSPMMSEFHGRPFTLRGAVVLPDGWQADGEQVYPIIYTVPGFGGRHTEARRIAQRLEASAADDSMRKALHVVLDPSCYRGHSVFADSENNGPWGTALVQEFIPALEEAFHGPKEARFRYVTGVSSGGWSSLWLQVVYPDSFGACFSHVPDPVDFRDFQRINLYRDEENMYVDPQEERRPLARRGEEYILWYDDFVGREAVLGPGGQIHSFEAVFSKRKPDGTPELVFDRESGVVDLAVAKSWEPYDIDLIIQSNWTELKEKLEGRVHVYAGEVDTFFLEGAVALLSETFENLEADVVCETIPGMAHSEFPGGVESMYHKLFQAWDAAQQTKQP